MGFSLVGTIIAIIMLLPNIIFFIKFPPERVEGEKSNSPKVFEILEKLGQAGCIISLVFLKDFFKIGNINWIAIAIIICTATYYALWIVVVIKGGDFSIMLKPLWIIPIPGAVLPVCVFLFTALWGTCIWLGIAAVVLAIGHCAISWESYKRIK